MRMVVICSLPRIFVWSNGGRSDWLYTLFSSENLYGRPVDLTVLWRVRPFCGSGKARRFGATSVHFFQTTWYCNPGYSFCSFKYCCFPPICRLVYSSTLKMEAICCSETSGFFRTARPYNREDPHCSVEMRTLKRPRLALLKITTDHGETEREGVSRCSSVGIPARQRTG
jgi:hypothetical protein